MVGLPNEFMSKLTDTEKEEISNVLDGIAVGAVDYEEGTDYIKSIILAH